MHTSTDDQELHSSGLEAVFEDFYGFVNVDCASAVEEIDGGVAVLWPGVDSEVRFLDDDGTGDAVGFEFVEVLGDDGGFSGFSGGHHGFADGFF